ncbi:hypothetical protein P9112_012351 [Eukaryota sp. TZLM1-RC]
MSIVAPLAVLNITDHLTRNAASSLPSSLPHRARGFLLGKFEGNIVSIVTAFPSLTVQTDDGSVIFDPEFAQARFDQYTAVFKTLYIVGTYTFGYDLLDLEEESIKCRNILNTLSQNNADILPNQATLLTISTTTDRSRKGSSLINLYDVSVSPPTELTLSIHSSEPERVCLENLHKGTDESFKSSLESFEKRISPLSDSVNILQDQLTTLADYLTKVSKGEAPYNSDLLKLINAIYSSLPQTSEGLVFSDNSNGLDVLSTSTAFLMTAANKALDITKSIDVLPRMRESEGHLSRMRDVYRGEFRL